MYSRPRMGDGSRAPPVFPAGTFLKQALDKAHHIGALIIRTGFGGMFYYNYNKELPKILF